MYALDCCRMTWYSAQALDPRAAVAKRHSRAGRDGGDQDEELGQVARLRDHDGRAADRLQPGRDDVPVVGRSVRCAARVRDAGVGGDVDGSQPDSGRLRHEGRSHDVGALRRQQGDGRSARGRLEREVPRLQDQSDLHSARRDGRQDRPGHRFGRGPGSDGHGPDLRAAVREGQAAGRRHGPAREPARAQDGEPRPHDRRDVGEPAVRRPALCRRVGPLLQQEPLHQGRPRPEQASDQSRSAARVRRQESPHSATTSRATTCRATAPAATSSPSGR